MVCVSGHNNSLHSLSDGESQAQPLSCPASTSRREKNIRTLQAAQGHWVESKLYSLCQPIPIFSHYYMLFYKFIVLQLLRKMDAWVAQSVECPTQAQVMISQFGEFKPHIGFHADSAEPTQDSLSLLLSLSLLCSCSPSLSLSNFFKKITQRRFFKVILASSRIVFHLVQNTSKNFSAPNCF